MFRLPLPQQHVLTIELAIAIVELGVSASSAWIHRTLEHRVGWVTAEAPAGWLVPQRILHRAYALIRRAERTAAWANAAERRREDDWWAHSDLPFSPRPTATTVTVLRQWKRGSRWFRKVAAIKPKLDRSRRTWFPFPALPRTKKVKPE